MIGFCFGVMAFLLLPLAFYHYWWAFIAFTILLILLSRFIRFEQKRYLTPFSLGLTLSACFAAWGNAHLIPKSLEKQDLVVKGVVSGLPLKSGNRCRFNLDVDSISSLDAFALDNASTHNKALTWTPRQIQLNHYQCEELIPPGQKISAVVRLKQPHSFANQGGFDFERSWFSQGVDARGYVRSIETITKQTSFIERSTVDRWRFSIAQKLDEADLDEDAKPILKAILLGDKRGLNQQAWRTLRNTGTVHLLIISGLHICLVSGFVVLTICGMGRLLSAISVQKRRQVAVVVALLSALLYALMAGFTLPTQRALVMTSVVLLSWLSVRHYSIIQRLALAAVIVLVIDPLAYLSAGFWLSFAATTILLYLIAGSYKQRHWLVGLFKLQFGLFLISIPLLAFWFYQVPLVSMVFNLFAVPLVSFFLLPFSLVGLILWLVADSLGVAGISLLSLSADCWAFFWLGLTQGELWLSQQWHLGQPSLLVTVLALIGTLWLLTPKPILGRLLGAVLWLPLFFVPETKLEPGDFKVSMIDVGQGLSVLVNTENHFLLYDTGASFNDFSIAGITVIPFLQSQHIQTLDKLVISHGDNDHRGGLSAISDAFEIKDVVENSQKHSGCHVGQYWVWDSVRFEYLHPSHPLPEKSNNRSCVLKVSNGLSSILLTGDIEAEIEAELIKNNKLALKADVLLVPHHGSKTSSSLTFLEAVNPEVAINSAGYLNRYKHPHPDIEQRYSDSGIPFYNTAHEGQIFVHFDNRGRIDVSTFRSTNLAFWRR